MLVYGMRYDYRSIWGEAMSYTYTIKGRPVTKKNSQRLTKWGGVIQSKSYCEYESLAIIQLQVQKGKQGPHKPIDRPCTVKFMYYLPNRQWWPDLLGLMQATADILQKARIWEDDRLLHDFEGRSCIAGIDPDNPRAEITITEITDLRHPAYHLDPWVKKRLEAGMYEDVHKPPTEEEWEEIEKKYFL